ncbi:MAG: methyl-accepting chemotaxis protein [Planctomycetes bacterium]|nr:methyl-accepting chemotaxis protein [Planctomycetota bacterium]
MRRNGFDSAKREVLAVAQEHSREIEGIFNEGFQFISTLAATFSAVKDTDSNLDLTREKVIAILKVNMKKYPFFSGIFTCWEVDAYDGMDVGYENETCHDPTGRFAVYTGYDEDGGQISASLLECPEHSPGGVPGDWYDMCKKSKTECVTAPYLHDVKGEGSLITTITVPIVANDVFYGVMGVDINLTELQKITDAADVWDGSGDLFVFSADGMIISASEKHELIGKHMSALHTDFDKDISRVMAGEDIAEEMNELLEVCTAIAIGDSGSHWGVNVLIPIQVVIDKAEDGMVLILTIGIFSIILMMILFFITVSKSVSPLQSVIGAASEIANLSGDLTQHIPVTSNDEIGRLASTFNDLILNLRDLMMQVREAGMSITKATHEIVSSSRLHLAGASEQSSTILDTTATMNELTVSSSKIASNTEGIAAKATVLGEKVKGSKDALNMANNVMGTIRESSENCDDAILKVENESQTVEEIIGTIRAIADQTKMLAVNASIEASRVGDEGKGFAVVASEIRNLAGDARKATEEVNSLLLSIQSSSAIAAKAARENRAQVHQGMEVVGGVQEQLTSFFSLIETSSDLIQQVNVAIQQQSSASRQIAESMSEIESISKQSAAGANQTCISAEGLDSLANDLSAVISKFKLE